MTPFRFRLDRVLRLRLGLERARAADLGAALGAEAERREDLAAAERRLERAGTPAGGPPGTAVPAGALQVRSEALRAAAEEVREAAARIRGAEARSESERERFRSAKRDRESLERLRENRRDDWRIASAREAQKDVDETVQRRRNDGRDG